mmetsp:Transcript_21678/g.31060  ORF Transcript_21678/g.31060 Transcript_21678/m.31060 type:complete len:325 (+) Transcript_21678:25-999(+)
MVESRGCCSSLMYHLIHVCQHRKVVSKSVLVILSLFAAVQLFMQHRAPREELIQALQFPAYVNDKRPPSHMEPVNTKDLLPFDLLPIDEVHKKGLLHEGTFLFILDADHKLLLTYRSPYMVTCPNTWMPPGEQNRAYEKPIETAQRGIEEEFGKHVFSKYVTQMTNLTENALFYLIDSGSENGNRIDKQLTSLWYVQLSQPGKLIEDSMTIDVENTKLLWLSFPEVSKWINDKPADFCHQTFIDLIEIGLTRLSEISTEKQHAFQIPIEASNVQFREVKLSVWIALAFLSFFLCFKSCPFFCRILCRQKPYKVYMIRTGAKSLE